ncbi:hypothetical protein [Jiella pacifica]|uniref:Uncharacterized protein n=1 Tax=Jiella pacifica TaxID=2696469 RepID=A0A6N9TE91_9HYPH|nr:hypothetical protein [Jiella pacifica]NDW07989.1 hypothetical protein [Jiella pacifica]
MPIKPELRGFYPLDWPQLSQSIRFRRARGRCEHCGRAHGQIVCHLGDGRWFDAELGRWRDTKGRKIRTNLPAPEDLPPEIPALFTRVFLACAHLDHDVGNNAAANLAALCQRCHMIHDRPHHLTRRRITYLMRRAVGDLFMGIYR